MLTILRGGDLLELAIMVFQVLGVLSLGAFRLLPEGRWTPWARYGFFIALMGLGLTGAWCGTHDSEFGLFAGGTITTLLIGMTVGGSPAGSHVAAHAEA